jgi:hypothetical protein
VPDRPFRNEDDLASIANIYGEMLRRKRLEKTGVALAICSNTFHFADEIGRSSFIKDAEKDWSPSGIAEPHVESLPAKSCDPY